MPLGYLLTVVTAEAYASDMFRLPIVTSPGPVGDDTEHGIADLWGKNLRQRAAALIAIAHPSQRDALTAEARRRFGTW